MAGHEPEKTESTVEPHAEAKTRRYRYAEKLGIKDEYAGERIKDLADKAAATCVICALILGFLIWQRSTDILGFLSGFIVAGAGILASYFLVSVLYSYGDMIRITVEQTKMLKRLETKKISELLEANNAEKLEQQKKEILASEPSAPPEQKPAEPAPPAPAAIKEESKSKIEAVPPETAAFVDKLNRVARFTERPYTGIICPICARRQTPDRDTCFYCGCQFVFDDEAENGQPDDSMDRLSHSPA